MFDAEKGRIQITSADSESESTRAMWGIPWGRKMANSILQHELVHAFVSAIPNAPADFISREYLAYSVQFELMEPDLRKRILDAYADVQAFASTTSICDAIYLIEPDMFGLRAYLFTNANGRDDFIRAILSGDTKLQTTRSRDQFCPTYSP